MPVLMPKLILIMINHGEHNRVKVAVGLSGGGKATISPYKNGSAKIEFLEPQEGVCPGQFAVFYSGDTVIVGGIIIKSA